MRDKDGYGRPVRRARNIVVRLGGTPVRAAFTVLLLVAALLAAVCGMGVGFSALTARTAGSTVLTFTAVFGITAGQVDGLELVNDQKLAQSDARAVLFRQAFGELTPALDSMVTVGVAHGDIAYVSSSITRTTGTPPAAIPAHMSTLGGLRHAPRPPRSAIPEHRQSNQTSSLCSGKTAVRVASTDWSMASSGSTPDSQERHQT